MMPRWPLQARRGPARGALAAPRRGRPDRRTAPPRGARECQRPDGVGGRGWQHMPGLRAGLEAMGVVLPDQGS
eukprot:8411460-Pyramimonas_sp.AAC.1